VPQVSILRPGIARTSIVPFCVLSQTPTLPRVCYLLIRPGTEVLALVCFAPAVLLVWCVASIGFCCRSVSKSRRICAESQWMGTRAC
jgi:hypothetical protein